MASTGRRRRGRKIVRARPRRRATIKQYLEWAHDEVFRIPNVDKVAVYSVRSDDGTWGKLALQATLKSGVVVEIVERVTTRPAHRVYDGELDGVFVTHHSYRLNLLDDTHEGFDCDPHRHGDIRTAPYHRHTPQMDEPEELRRGDPRCLRDLVRIIPQY